MFPNIYGLDSTYIFIIIGAVLTLGASALVNATFSKYSAVRSLSGMTGAQAAQRILNQAGIYDVTVEHINGKLTDHYDPSAKVLRLSDSVYGQSSVAAIGVAAHECGHAIQHQHGYVPLRLRTAIVPLANFGSKISWPLIVLGIFLSMSQTLIYAGIILFSFAVVFQIVTLPVEFNASRRAVKILDESGILYGEEVQITKKVLGTAALTYVAGAAASVLQLLRLIRIFGGNNRD